MVQEFQSTIWVYKYPFELVMAAYECRFPTSPLIPVFLGSELLLDQKSDDGAVHTIERRCKLDVEAPGWFKKILGVDHIFFIQRNTLNRRERTLLIEAWNESFSSKVEINEKCRYKVHPENGEWTAFDQEARLKVKSFLGMESAIEKYAMKNYLKNINRGKEVIEYYVAELKSKGVTHIAPFDTKVEVIAQTPVDVEDVKLSQEDYKLESTYVKRYLGDLLDTEVSELIKLRERLTRMGRTPLPNDKFLLRFLRAREFNLERTMELLLKSLEWRKENNVDEIYKSWEAPEVFVDYFPGGWGKPDKEGRPVFIMRLGQIDIKGIVRSAGERSVLKQMIKFNEEAMKNIDTATENSGKPILDCTCLVDLEGLSLRHLWRPGLSLIQKMIQIDSNNYPETMSRLVIVRAPRIFPVVWSIVRNVFDERTRNKIVICGDDYRDVINELIPEAHVPDFLGGKHRCDFSTGGIVPKSLYLPSDSSENVMGNDDAVYTTAQISRGSTFRVPIEVKAPDTVITWDFNVIGSDIGFAIYVCPSGTDPGEAHASDMEEVQAYQKHVDGESVQGSIVCSRVGCFVLRWDNTYSWMLSKSIRYHVDVIDPLEYRRSMSSLISADTMSIISGLSQMSADTSAISHLSR